MVKLIFRTEISKLMFLACHSNKSRRHYKDINATTLQFIALSANERMIKLIDQYKLDDHIISIMDC